uniref:Uncharacterized protein n=1 Tax=Oryza punctata TaxID=4537 RepID=A0A0E0JF12_ORYPU
MAVTGEIEQQVAIGKHALWEEDFSGTCQRECFCASCFHAFCTHCCWDHHEPTIHMVFPVAADSAGRPVFATHGPDGGRIHPDFVEDILAAQDYATRLPWDSFCLLCSTAFAAAACPDHHRHHHPRSPDAVLRVEQRGGRHCVRCTGSEWWFPYVEQVLDDPVEDDGDEQLLPVLTTRPGTCKQCGDTYIGHAILICSDSCRVSYRRDLAGRRQRREVRQAARAAADSDAAVVVGDGGAGGEIENQVVLGKQALWVADFSGTCRRECFCASCFHAFCTHCCWHHHEPSIHMVFPIAADSAGRPVFATHGPDGGRVHPDFVEDILAAQDYATRLLWNAFCLLCHTAFNSPQPRALTTTATTTRACPTPSSASSSAAAATACAARGLRNSEWWFPYVEQLLDEDHDGGDEQLLPVLTTRPGTCKQCGGPHTGRAVVICSDSCGESYRRDLAGRRRPRREVRQAARAAVAKQLIDRLTTSIS